MENGLKTEKAMKTALGCLTITKTWKNSMPGKEGKKTVGYSGQWKEIK